MKGHRSGPTHHPQRLGRESGHLTPLTSKEVQAGSWAGGLSFGGSERQSWEVLSQPLQLGCGWTGGGADSENLWLKRIFATNSQVRLGAQGLVRTLWTKRPTALPGGFARARLRPSFTCLDSWGCPEPGPPGTPGENVLLGPPQEQC